MQIPVCITLCRTVCVAQGYVFGRIGLHVGVYVVKTQTVWGLYQKISPAKYNLTLTLKCQK